MVGERNVLRKKRARLTRSRTRGGPAVRANHDIAGCRSDQTRGRLDGRGLSRTIRSEERDHLAALYLEGQRRDRGHTAEALGKGAERNHTASTGVRRDERVVRGRRPDQRTAAP